MAPLVPPLSSGAFYSPHPQVRRICLENSPQTLVQLNTAACNSRSYFTRTLKTFAPVVLQPQPAFLQLYLPCWILMRLRWYFGHKKGRISMRPSCILCGAEERTRTFTQLPAPDPEPGVSTNSTTSAGRCFYPLSSLFARVFSLFADTGLDREQGSLPKSLHAFARAKRASTSFSSAFTAAKKLCIPPQVRLDASALWPLLP